MEVNFLRKNWITLLFIRPPFNIYSFQSLYSARVVSLTVVRDDEVLSETDTIFVMQFGQIVDHGKRNKI